MIIVGNKVTKLDKILRYPILVLASLFMLSALIIFTYLNELNSELIETNTEQAARQYAEVLTAFRTLYTAEVVNKAIKNGLVASHNYQDIDNAIPLPATLSMLLGEKMGMAGLDVRTKLYSAYPFPWREKSGGLTDQFAQNAWQYLQATSDQAYVAITEFEGQASVRYAVADIMRPSCVSCHNNHPQSPKNDWQIGDVRGVLEVTLPLKAGLLSAKAISVKIITLIVIMLLTTLAVLYLLLRSLNSKHQETLLLNHELTAEVKERHKAEQNAIAANNTKSLFLANISHEIRTPMNAILGYTQLIQRDKNLTQEQYDSLSVIAHSGEHLLGLINDVLDISKIESGILELHETQFDLNSLLIGISDMFRLKTRQKGLNWKLYLDFPSQHLKVLGDESKLRQILINLIGNAVKFTESGFVQLKVVIQAQHKFYFEVSDSGMGIGTEELTQLFTPFSQGKAGLTKGGTGLGLSISKRYLQLMQSDLSMISVPDQGTKISFTLQLPVTESIVPIDNDARRIKQLAKGQSMHVLVIDDNEINRDVLAKMLNGIGIQVTCAEDGEHALAILSQQKFSVIFTDIDMPKLDGYQLMTKIAHCKLNNKTAVIAISASTLEQSKAHFTELGFTDFLGKPFLINDLYQCIKATTGAEFEYETVTISPHEQVAVPLKLPEATVLRNIVVAAELSLISEIESIVKDLVAQDPSYQAFAHQLNQYVASYDMDGLLQFLAQPDER